MTLSIPHLVPNESNQRWLDFSPGIRGVRGKDRFSASSPLFKASVIIAENCGRLVGAALVLLHLSISGLWARPMLDGEYAVQLRHVKRKENIFGQTTGLRGAL